MTIRKIAEIIMALLRFMIAAWLTFMGCVATFLLYNELMNPMWGRQNKLRFPETPPWYIDAIIAAAALACFYLSYRLIFKRSGKQEKPKTV